MRVNYTTITLRYRLAVVLIAFCAAITPPAPAHSATSYSIPAGQLLPYLQYIRVPSVVRIKYRNKPWQPVATREEHNTCSIGSKGILTALRTAMNRQVVACEWSIFSPQTRLVPGWLVHRAHWHGDIRQAQFIANPTYTDQPFFSVQLAMPDSAAGESSSKASTTHKIGLRLLTLRGPEDSNWRGAFER